MKATVTVNSRGVVTLPARLRQALGLKADDQLIAETTPEGLLLRPAVTLPVEIYTPEREREFDAAEAELAALLAERNAAPLAVLLFDLDGFKAVNDAHGHAAGDALLVAVARRALDCVRSSDTVGRLGGDEFLVLLPDTDRDGARSVAHKLLEVMARPFEVGAAPVRVSASIGGAFLPGPARGAGALVRAADAALYESKRKGRNAYTQARDAQEAPVPGAEG